MPPPPGGGKTEVVAKLGAEFDSREIAKGLKRMEAEWDKRMHALEKATQAMSKGASKSLKGSIATTGESRKAFKRMVDEQVKGGQKARASFENNRRSLRAVNQEVAKLREELQAVNREAEPELFATVSKRLEDARKKAADLAKAMPKGGAGGGPAPGATDPKWIKSWDKGVAGFNKALLAAQGLGEALWEPIESLRNKDIPGALEKGGKLAGKGWEKIFKGSGKLAQGLGKAIGEKGGKGFQKLMGTGKVGGAIGGAGAKGFEAIGKLVSSMGPLLKAVGSLGPILSTLSSVIVGIVKLFIDAEATAKDLNKQILSSAGSADFLRRNMGNAGAAAYDLESTLRDIRDAATSLDNMDWGINKETHTAVLNSITAEGVSLTKLDDDFQRVAKSAKEGQGYVKDWGSMVQMSVAYSRAFGVSLNDISQLEGEMMSEMGMNVTQVESSFQTLLRSAEESTIGTNKFFALIRGFSADLTLFNIRMEDVAHTMVMLGKAMSPREAQKMMQGLMGMFKNRSLIDRTKDVIMGGSGVRKAMEAQQEAGVKGLAADVGITPKEMKKVLKKSDKQLADWLATDGKKLNADQRKAVIEAALMEHKLDTGDTIDLASAIKDSNPWTAKKIADAKVAAITGGKKIDQLTGMSRIAAEQAADVSDELADQIKKMAMGQELMKADLVQKLKSAQGDASKFSDEEKKLLGKLGVNIKDSSTFDKVSAATDEDFYTSLSQDQKDLLAGSKKDIDYQKDTAKFQTSLLDKLQNLIDFVMNQLYNVFADIWDSVLDVVDAIPGTGDHKMQKLQAQAIKAGNKELIDIANKTATPDDFKNAIFKSDAGKKTEAAMLTVGKKIDDAQKEYSDLTEKYSKASSDDEKKSLEEQLKANQKTRDALSDEFSGLLNAIQTQAGGSNEKGSFAYQQLVGDRAKSAAKMTGMSEEDATKLGDKIREGADLGGAMEALNLSADQQGKIMEKMRLTLSPEQLSRATADAMKAIPAQDPKAVADATVDAQKAANPDAAAAASAAVKSGSIYTHDETAEGYAEEMMEQAELGTDKLDDIYRALRFRGIKIDKPFLQNQIKDTIQTAVYDAASDALYEYALLTNWDKMAEWAKWAKDKGQKLGKGVALGGALSTAIGMNEDMAGVVQLPGHKAGGMVTAIQNGLAQVRPAAGEGLASIGLGENIGAAGRGGTVTHVIKFKEGAEKLFDVRTDNRIANHETKKRSR